uniref:tRNA (guanine(10)-N(2))-methyltransferase TRMT11 n=1 Tax=Lygus hesperus TaxID=30085 RepID=A0A0A9YBK2_LYGHE
MESPDVVFVLYVEFGKHFWDSYCESITILNTEPVAWYFTRRIVHTNPYYTELNVNKRPYIGPTSTDAELAFYMTNFCKIHSESFVYDPFVGTGSLLLAAAKHKAICFGQDLDIGILQGGYSINCNIPRNPDKNVNKNFTHFNLSTPELLCGDNSKPVFIHLPDGIFDAIICDPPFGIRAGAKCLGPKASRMDKYNKLLQYMHDNRDDKDIRKRCYPMTKPYPLQDVVYDLFHTSAIYLRLHGRLCFLLPILPTTSYDALPTHPCFIRKYACDQIIQGNLRRTAITFEKILPYSHDYDIWPSSQKELPTPDWVITREMIFNTKSF